MYLAKNVGGWSTTKIGRFYNGRHHTTVLHAIEKIERLRQTDESVDALIEVLTAELSPRQEGRFTERFEPGWTAALIEAVADAGPDGDSSLYIWHQIGRTLELHTDRRRDYPMTAFMLTSTLVLGIVEVA